MTPQDDLPETGTGEETENEVLRAARELQAQKEAADATEAADKGDEAGRKKGWKTAATAAGTRGPGTGGRRTGQPQRRRGQG